MRIIQLLPTISFGDAVSNDALAIRRMLTEMGCDTALYAEHIEPRLSGEGILPREDMGEVADSDLLIYHGSTGDPLNLKVPGIGGRKILRYHNITPSHFFSGYSRYAEVLTATGRREMRELAGAFDYGMADSDYNRRDLREMGYRCPIDVCPVAISFEDYDREPDQEVLDRYRDDGWTNLLFVGRITPNKKQEDVIRAFHYYHRYFNSRSRLFLVGNPAGMQVYRGQLERYAAKLGLAEHVVFSGQISFRAILAYYRLADVFVCMSEHEGFCVPLVEAMHFGVPIVAYAAAAVPETLGGGGLLLRDRDPVEAAAAIDRILRDDRLREKAAAEQKRMLGVFRYENVRERLKECLGRVT